MLRETHQDLVVRSSDFRVEKSAWERPLWIVLHLIYEKRGKIVDYFVKSKIWKFNKNWVGDKKQSACGCRCNVTLSHALLTCSGGCQ